MAKQTDDDTTTPKSHIEIAPDPTTSMSPVGIEAQNIHFISEIGNKYILNT